MTSDNRDKFTQLAERYNQIVEFHNVEELCADKIEEIRKYLPFVDKNRFTIGAFYRFFIPFVLSTEIEKAIYLDGDIIVNMDINELWQIDLEDKPLGVVNGYPISLKGIVKDEDYFNNGVMFMNLKILRDEYDIVRKGMQFFAENPQLLIWPDQTLFNYCFSTRTVRLPKKFNFLLNGSQRAKESLGRKIYHYVGLGSSLNLNMDDPFNKLWMSYFIKTPFFNEESIGRLYKCFLQSRSELKNSALKLSAMVSGKSRGFFIEDYKTDWLKKIFSIRDDEIIIPAKNKESIQELINAMKSVKGKFIFFIITDRWPKPELFPFDLLIKEGFVEGADFVKSWNYLDLPMNSYWMISGM